MFVRGRFQRPPRLEPPRADDLRPPPEDLRDVLAPLRALPAALRPPDLALPREALPRDALARDALPPRAPPDFLPPAERFAALARPPAGRVMPRDNT